MKAPVYLLLLLTTLPRLAGLEVSQYYEEYSAIVTNGEWERAEALAQILPVFEANPDDAATAAAYRSSLVDLARLIGVDDPRRAEALYEKALLVDHTDLTALFWYAVFLREERDYEKALAMFAEAEKHHPDFEHLPINTNHTYFEYGRDLDQRSERAKAADMYERASARFPMNLYYFHALVNDYLALDRLEEARDVLIRWSRAKEESGLSGDALFSEENTIGYRVNDLVMKYVVADDLDSAFALLEAVEPLFVNRHIILNREGELRWLSGDVESGIALANRAYELYICDHREHTEAITVGLPLRGVFLVAVGTSSPVTITHAGMARYCFDFMGCDESGRTTRPGTEGAVENDDYYGFGIPVYSPVDGVVVSVIDEGVDHAPTGTWMYHHSANSITIQDGEKRNFVFVHLKHRSAVVQPRQTVTVGQKIAELGNTASSVPHLHFGVWTEEWTVTIPVRFAAYTEIGTDRVRISRSDAAPAEGTIISME